MTSNAHEEPPASRPGGAPEPSWLAWLGIAGALTICALAAGSWVGLLIGGTPIKDCSNPAKGASGAEAAKYGGDVAIRGLPPISTNLAEPPGVWVRVQASIVFDSKAVQKPDFIAAQIGDDILGLMRTLSLAQIGGASGLQHLREDLNERAAIRSGGLVRELVLQSVVFQ